MKQHKHILKTHQINIKDNLIEINKQTKKEYCTGMISFCFAFGISNNNNKICEQNFNKFLKLCLLEKILKTHKN